MNIANPEINKKVKCFITNFIVIMDKQQKIHNNKNTTNLIAQCNDEPNSPLTPISPTILNAILNATNPNRNIIIEFTK